MTSIKVNKTLAAAKARVQKTRAAFLRAHAAYAKHIVNESKFLEKHFPITRPDYNVRLDWSGLDKFLKKGKKKK